MDTHRARATGSLRHLTADVTVRQSEFWNSNAGIVDTGAGVVLVDPGIIAAAPADESDEALAQRALAELAEGRAEDGVSAHFHLDNVRLLRRGSRTPVTTED